MLYPIYPQPYGSGFLELVSRALTTKIGQLEDPDNVLINAEDRKLELATKQEQQRQEQQPEAGA